MLQNVLLHLLLSGNIHDAQNLLNNAHVFILTDYVTYPLCYLTQTYRLSLSSFRGR